MKVLVKKTFLGLTFLSLPSTLFPLTPVYMLLFLSSFLFLLLLSPSFPRAETWILVCKGEIEKQMERKTQARSVVTLTSVLVSPFTVIEPEESQVTRVLWLG